MASTSHLERMVELAAAGEAYVVVTVVDLAGSTPTAVGAKMIVTRDGRNHGSVGGGRVEARAIDEAQGLLTSGGSHLYVDWSLKADVGMTCGGRVRMFFESIGGATWNVVVFGAGHVTQALAAVLAPMPCHVTCIDPRAEWLDELPVGVSTVRTDDPPAEVDRLTDADYVLCMTRGHASDLPVLLRAFQAGRRFAFLGVIGSKAKAAVLRRELEEAGIARDRLDFHCPVGLPIGSNHPAEIAVSIAAQLLAVRDASVGRSADRPIA
ncbi:MAG: xanthine dehydrogenase accessory protein XdhC [Lacipirellulaceae bacterium]